MSPFSRLTVCSLLGLLLGQGACLLQDNNGRRGKPGSGPDVDLAMTDAFINPASTDLLDSDLFNPDLRSSDLAGCIAKSCGELGKNCGAVDTGCGLVDCGTCSGMDVCSNENLCISGTTTGSSLVLNQVAYTVSGVITLEGAVPSKGSDACDPNQGVAKVVFWDKAAQYFDSVVIPCSTIDFSWTARLPPGTYEVQVVGIHGNLLDAGYVAIPALVLSSPLSGIVLNEGPSYAVSGKVRADGTTPKILNGVCTSFTPMLSLVFTEQTQGHKVYAFASCTDDFSFSTTLPKGVYDVLVTPASTFDPTRVDVVRSPHVATKGLVVNGPRSNVNIDDSGVKVSGKLTVEGATPTQTNVPCSPSVELVSLDFYNEATDSHSYESIPCTTTDFSWSTRVPPGTYRVTVWRKDFAPHGTNLPLDVHVPFTALNLLASVAGLVIDQSTFPVSGTITVEGMTPTPLATPCGASDVKAELVFVDKAKGNWQFLDLPCGGSDFSWSTRLPAGTYEVRVRRIRGTKPGGAAIADIKYLANAALVVSGPLAGLTMNAEQTFPVTGRVTIDGKTPTKNGLPCGANGLASVLFFEPTKSYQSYATIACGSSDLSWSAALPAGTYEVRVSAPVGTSSIEPALFPVDYLANPALLVSGPQSNVVLDEVRHPVTGVVQVNGAVPTTNGTFCSSPLRLVDITFVDSTHIYSLTQTIDCTTSDFSFATHLPAGLYDVTLQPGMDAGLFALPLLPSPTKVAAHVAVP